MAAPGSKLTTNEKTPKETAEETPLFSARERNLPRIAIKYCTQCRWMLRAAYFAQELLSTFSTSIGEVALVPATGGIFTVSILYSSSSSAVAAQDTAAEGGQPGGGGEVVGTLQEAVLWDRKRDGGFPETKQLKSLVRNIIDPSRDLGHVDRALAKGRRGSGDDSRQSGQKVVAELQEGSQIPTTTGLPASTEPGVKPAECEDCK